MEQENTAEIKKEAIINLEKMLNISLLDTSKSEITWSNEEIDYSNVEKYLLVYSKLETDKMIKIILMEIIVEVYSEFLDKNPLDANWEVIRGSLISDFDIHKETILKSADLEVNIDGDVEYAADKGLSIIQDLMRNIIVESMSKGLLPSDTLDKTPHTKLRNFSFSYQTKKRDYIRAKKCEGRYYQSIFSFVLYFLQRLIFAIFAACIPLIIKFETPLYSLLPIFWGIAAFFLYPTKQVRQIVVRFQMRKNGPFEKEYQRLVGQFRIEIEQRDFILTPPYPEREKRFKLGTLGCQKFYYNTYIYDLKSPDYIVIYHNEDILCCIPCKVLTNYIDIQEFFSLFD